MSVNPSTPDRTIPHNPIPSSGGDYIPSQSKSVSTSTPCPPTSTKPVPSSTKPTPTTSKPTPSSTSVTPTQPSHTITHPVIVPPVIETNVTCGTVTFKVHNSNSATVKIMVTDIPSDGVPILPGPNDSPSYYDVAPGDTTIVYHLVATPYVHGTDTVTVGEALPDYSHLADAHVSRDCFVTTTPASGSNTPTPVVDTSAVTLVASTPLANTGAGEITGEASVAIALIIIGSWIMWGRKLKHAFGGNRKH